MVLYQILTKLQSFQIFGGYLSGDYYSYNTFLIYTYLVVASGDFRNLTTTPQFVVCYIIQKMSDTYLVIRLLDNGSKNYYQPI